MIRLLVLDVDGTMTDGGVYYDATGNELKKFAIKDGAGLVLARTAGIRVMICTGRECEAVRRRALQSGAVAPAVGLGAKAARRDPRPGEVDGKDYFFVTRTAFDAMVAADELLEHAEYVGNYYGTPLKPIQAALAAGTDVVMDVDVVGALNIKKRLPEAVLVFMAAPSMAEIHRRLAARGDVSPELMEKRMDRAKWEYGQAGQYDYLVVNDTVEHAAQELLAIMTAEKCKMMDRIHCIKEEL